MIAHLRNKLAIFINKFHRRKGPSFRDQCAKVIMHTCSLQLERGETRELAPALGATGPMLLSGGAITTVTYKVFDVEADKVDKLIRQEPWRAFADVTMRVSLERDPEFETAIGSTSVEPSKVHKAPGLALVKHLATYFPLLPRPHTGPTYAPKIEDTPQTFFKDTVLRVSK